MRFFGSAAANSILSVCFISVNCRGGSARQIPTIAVPLLGGRPVGSDPTAAGGGRREGSEWQRSAALSGVASAGHRNRASLRHPKGDYTTKPNLHAVQNKHAAICAACLFSLLPQGGGELPGWQYGPGRTAYLRTYPWRSGQYDAGRKLPLPPSPAPPGASAHHLW